VGGTVQREQVKVDLTESIDPLFSSFFGGQGATVHGSAIARIKGSLKPACLIALASGPETLRITGNGAMTLNGCVAVANSTSTQGIYVHGSGSLVADCVYSGSGHAHDHKENSLVTTCSPEIQEDQVANPYEDLQPPTKVANCYEPKNKSDPLLPTPRVVGTVKYYDLCSLAIDEDTTLPAGVYIIYGGDITDTGQNTVTGTNVTFYLTAKASAPSDFARINVNGAKLNLQAPTGAPYPYPGVVFFADKSSTVTHRFGGNSALKIQGALYAKSGTLDYGGGGSAMGCAQIIASKINITGNGGVGYDCAGKGLTTVTAGTAELSSSSNSMHRRLLPHILPSRREALLSDERAPPRSSSRFCFPSSCSPAWRQWISASRCTRRWSSTKACGPAPKV
jgi:hypothetical protein